MAQDELQKLCVVASTAESRRPWRLGDSLRSLEKARNPGGLRIAWARVLAGARRPRRYPTPSPVHAALDGPEMGHPRSPSGDRERFARSLHVLHDATQPTPGSPPHTCAATISPGVRRTAPHP